MDFTNYINHLRKPEEYPNPFGLTKYYKSIITNKQAMQKYISQSANAKKRNIEFNLTFDEWYNWWLSYGIDKNQEQLPLQKHQLCMCRIHDIGPYQLDNIYCDTASNNLKDFHLIYTNRLTRGQKEQIKLGNSV